MCIDGKPGVHAPAVGCVCTFFNPFLPRSVVGPGRRSRGRSLRAPSLSRARPPALDLVPPHLQDRCLRLSDPYLLQADHLATPVLSGMRLGGATPRSTSATSLGAFTAIMQR